MQIAFTPAPVVNAGADGTVCANNAAIALNGSVTGATGGTWSGGTGTFSPNANTLNASYTPSAAELAAGSVTLTLTSAGNGTCNAVSDQVTWTITLAPTANAGWTRCCAPTTQRRCSPAPSPWPPVRCGVVARAPSTPAPPTWGPSTPPRRRRSRPAASRSPSPPRATACARAATDQVLLTFTDAPTANAGPDVTVCANNGTVALGGSVQVATGGSWSGGTGTFSPNANTLNASYTGAADIAAGQVTLTLTTTGNGTCNAATDTRTIFITPAPIVDAGVGGTVCANASNITLSGTVSGATGGVWSGGSGTFSPNNLVLNATYTPSAAEVAAGMVTLTLTSAGNGSCNPVSDQVTWTITPSPTVNAGADQTLCANNANAVLNAQLTVATGVQWSSGTGLYSPGSTAQNITYSPRRWNWPMAA
ncbi:MAG: hypothetical protein H6596_08490 [Flavobacteriales bacterium]|nr:hypothetical protein [Flavobacteriales bacterium]